METQIKCLKKSQVKKVVHLMRRKVKSVLVRAGATDLILHSINQAKDLKLKKSENSQLVM